MTPQQMTGLGVRLFAIFVALHSIKYLVGLPAEMAANPLAGKAYIAYGFGAFCLAVAALLWFFPMSVAARIVPRTRFENRLDVQALDAARVGSSLIGLWLVANALPSTLWFLFRGAMSVADRSIVGSLGPDEKADLAFYAAELALAFILIFKSHLFAAIAMRRVGRPEEGE